MASLSAADCWRLIAVMTGVGGAVGQGAEYRS